MSEQVFDRIITADINSSDTVVALFALVDGLYRFVARSAAPTILQSDLGIMHGLRLALQRLEEFVQFPLLTPSQDEFIGGSARTAFAACSDAAAPLRVAILGLTRSFSRTCAEHASQLPFVDLAGSFQMDTLGSPRGGQADILSAQPDVIILMGGFDDSNTALLEVAARRLVNCYKAPDVPQPAIICAVNQPALRTLNRILGPSFILYPIANPMPTPGIEQLSTLQDKLVELYEKRCLAKLPGYEELLSLSTRAPIATYRAMQTMRAYLTEPGRVVRPVLVHLGKETTSVWGGAAGEGGLGIQTTSVCSSASGTELKRWLPLGSAEADLVVDYIHGEHSTPLSEEGTNFSFLAAAHEALLAVIRLAQVRNTSAPPLGDTDFIALHCDYPVKDTIALLALLDTVEPLDASRIELDKYQIWTLLGTAVPIQPQIPIDILADSKMRYDGICLSPRGTSRSQKALTVQVTCASQGSTSDTFGSGIIQHIKLPKDELVQINARCGRGFSFYNQQRTIHLVSRVGPLGLFVDTRGRPLLFKQAGLFWRIRVGNDLQALTNI